MPSTREIEPVFLPPEAFGGALEMDEQGSPEEFGAGSAWDVAIRYHEFKSRRFPQSSVARLRRVSALAILERAREVMGSVVHPVIPRSAPWSELPPEADQAELDLEQTLEESPLGPQDIWMSFATKRRQAVILSVDTSLSMTGEKLALTAVVIAVVMLQFPEDPVGIVAFENEAKVIKGPDERLGLQELIERFLDVPAQGYTHLEDGLKAALKMTRGASCSGTGRPPSVVLLTDGKYTAGRDPAYLAPRFPHLVVLKMGQERASLELCRELARLGAGTLKQVGDLHALPVVMYSVVKDLLRGRSLA
ncbi:MAG: VWA domain-containing protein [Oligoflexia bacterium]|nr:VWA domain-containing protein [Oligoflexia bacterium]